MTRERQKGLRAAHFGDTVLLVPKKIAKKIAKIAKNGPIGDFWRFFFGTSNTVSPK